MRIQSQNKSVAVNDIITFSDKPKAKKHIVIGLFLNHESGGLMITIKSYSLDGTKTCSYFFDVEKKYFVVGHLSRDERILLSKFDLHGGRFPEIKSLKK